MFSNKFTIHFVYLLIYLNCNIPICLLSFTFKIVGPLLTEFRIDQMAFGQSWPKASSSIRPKATSTEKIWSILKFTTDWPKADWPNGALAYWPKKFPTWFPKPQKQLWASGQTNVINVTHFLVNQKYRRRIDRKNILYYSYRMYYFRNWLYYIIHTECTTLLNV